MAKITQFKGKQFEKFNELNNRFKDVYEKANKKFGIQVRPSNPEGTDNDTLLSCLFTYALVVAERLEECSKNKIKSLEKAQKQCKKFHMHFHTEESTNQLINVYDTIEVLLSECDKCIK